MATVHEQLEAARGEWGERGETLIDSGLDYGDGEPVLVLVRKRGHRYDISDRGRAVEKADAGAARRWLETAERVVSADGMNVDRAGNVFVPAVEGRDLAGLAARVAALSVAVYGALLELDE